MKPHISAALATFGWQPQGRKENPTNLLVILLAQNLYKRLIRAENG